MNGSEHIEGGYVANLAQCKQPTEQHTHTSGHFKYAQTILWPSSPNALATQVFTGFVGQEEAQRDCR